MCAVVAVAAVVLTRGNAGHTPETAAIAPTQPRSEPTTPQAPGCPASPELPQIRGDEAGNTTSGPEVVLALETAYYVQRSAAAVRAVLVPDGPFGSDAEIQSGIDAVPAGTTHCVQIAPAGPDRWMVTITEHRPAGSTVTLHQLISTTVRGPATLVAAVTPA
ncbi:hypothetical protein [Nocardia nova]|uniref:hypothetical protein n=1 Tax=Nocardia nova TaxID=37330 RepID=UPI0011B06F9C|nr:hypothetical protein [Nocardia nova]